LPKTCQESNATTKQPGLCPKREPYTVWLSPFGEYAREKAQLQTPAFSMGIGGALVAFEYDSMNDNALGFAGAYVRTHIHEEQGIGSANVNQGYLTLYGTLTAANGYFDLGVWGGYYDSNNERQIVFPGTNQTATSNTHGWQLAPHFEVGYNALRLQNCGMKWFGVEPFLMGDWVANWESSFRERGGGDLNTGQNARFCSLLRGESGLRFHEILQLSWGNLVLREKGSYAYQKAFHTGKITAFLIGAPGSFIVNTLTSAQNLGVIEFSMLFVPAKSTRPYVDLRYQGEFGSQYQSHQGVIEIGKKF
jgi:uncharacterized protein with beta-barrel porin domain